MRIVLLNDDFPPHSRGGAGVVAANLANGLKDAGHQVCVITTVRSAADEGETQINGVRVFRLRATYHERWRAYLSLRNPQVIGRVAKLFAELRPDVVHAHNIHHYLSYHCLKLAKDAGAKVFLTAHDVMLFHYGKLSHFINPADRECPTNPDYSVGAWNQFREYRLRYNPLRNFVIRHYLKKLDGLFAVSDALKEALEQNGIAAASVIHNGIDTDKWSYHQEETAAFKHKYSLNDKKIVLCSGRMKDAKGLGQLLEAMRIVKISASEAILVVGGGKEFAKLSAAETKDAVFTDWLNPEEMRAVIHASALVAVPSICFDSFPTATLEAMACGKPVVSTCFGGSKEAVVDEVTGCVVNPFNIEDMAQDIVRLLKDHALAERMGSAGQARVRAEFSLQRQVEATLARYRLSSDNNSTN